MSSRRRTRAALAAALIALLALLPASGTAQHPAVQRWSDLASAPGADSAQRAWIERHLRADERDSLAALVGALSAPAAAQAIAAMLQADGSVLVPLTEARALTDSFAVRPPDGAAGRMRVAYLSARLRVSVLDGWERLGVWARDFRDPAQPRAVAAARPAAAPRPAPGVEVRLQLDLAPAESLLAIVGTPELTPAAALARISTPAFDALLRHRNQSFYRLPWTRELLATSLAHAASPLATDRLYTFANPKGLLDYADVSRHRARYRALLDRMHAEREARLAEVAGDVAPYLPAGTRLERTVSVYFGDGADGWAVDDVAAVDLEWFKDDWPRLRATLAHETYHAAQHVLRRPDPAAPRDSAAAVLAEALESLFGEGTANFVAPARAMPDAERLAAARAGRAILDSLVDAVGRGDLATARALHDRGVSGGGPFYSLGAEMSAVIVRASGAAALAATLPLGGDGFVRAYLRAAARRPGDEAWLPPRVVARVGAR